MSISASVALSPKKVGEAIAFLVLMGTIGGHHFYLGNTWRAVLLACLTAINIGIAVFLPALALANWVLCGAVLLILIVDLFLMKKDVAQSNARLGLDGGLLLPSELPRS
ncbi:hypothetical protein [Leucobacter chromiiresistens]|uniref:hypothetical protein n=1 Tax=Leucobacter chromiiresistens TaxID=1079994 RepID=UPI0011600A38|nr:hypothetical protein [Leucobacter chromiiresistens]